jgi:hypothetical protein
MQACQVNLMASHDLGQSEAGRRGREAHRSGGRAAMEAWIVALASTGLQNNVAGHGRC